MPACVKPALLVSCILFSAFGQLDLSGLTPPAPAAGEPVSITITRPDGTSKDTLHIALTFSMKKNIHLYAAESLFFKIIVNNRKGLGKETIRLPKTVPFTNFDKTTVGVYTDGHTIDMTLPILSESWALGGSVRFQACDSTMCFTPRSITFNAASDGTLSTGTGSTPPLQTDISSVGAGTPEGIMERLAGFSVAGSHGGFLNVDQFSAFLGSPSGKESSSAGGFEEKGILLVIVLILLGGIALNLTPCVLPMIPITLTVIGAGSQAKSRGRGMFVGTVYGLAMALTYGILGVVVVVTGTRFGVINSSPLFNIMIAIVFILMALAMFDIIQVDFTRFRKGSGSGERGRLLTVFFMGIIASLLAGACVAPVVISVVLYAGTLYAGGNLVGLLLPFLLGVGMALPWPFAGAGLTFLPKPGKWMVWVKYVFGIFIAGMAVYYGYTGISLYRAASAPKNSTESVETKKESNLPWVHSLNEGLRRAEAEDKPVFIDFWATWCKNCKVMDATTFRDPSVEKLLSNYVLVKYQAEKPDEPDTKKLLDYFGVVGLPTYVVLKLK